MTIFVRIVFVLGLITLATGCAQISVTSPPPPSPAATPPPANDTRSIPQLRAENHTLRLQLAKAEKDCHAWETTVDRRKSELKAIEQDCDRVKDEMKYYKKLANRD